MSGTTESNHADLRERAAAMLAAAREDYAREARRGLAGVEAATHHAEAIDGIVRMVVDAACDRMATPVAVCAVGGYGRRVLCLHSDIDLLIVFGGTIQPDDERFVHAILQPLWDLKQIGRASCRERV